MSTNVAGCLELQDLESTWAMRNPLKAIIPPRVNKKKQLTDAEKATAQARQVVTRNNTEALQQAIRACLAARDAEVKHLAEVHAKKPEYIKRLLDHASCYTTHRRPSFYNALVHHRANELNKDREIGNQLTLAEIKAQVNDEMKSGHFSEEERAEMIKELQEYRETQQKGARCSNKAAALDFQFTVASISEEFENLSERTGCHAFAFMTRGHINDTTIPAWIETDDALSFVNEVLRITPAELARKFELWACAQDKRPNKLVDLQKACTRIITDGLNKLLHRRDLTMSYSKYNTNIRKSLKVQLRGWPDGIKFSTPSAISSMDDIQTLHVALKTGECKWVVMSRNEQEKLAEELKDKTPKKRATRSDKGKKRGPRITGGNPRYKENVVAGSDRESDDEDDDDYEEPPRKKIRTRGKASTKVPPVRRSCHIVNSEDEDESL